MSLMTSMWTQTLAQASRVEERNHFLFTPHVENDIKNVVKKNMAHQSRDLSGWDFEKKVSVLAELQDMVEAPCFKYVDWGGAISTKAKGISLLPLVLGQEALLDLWAYIMEFCDVVPVRTGARGLFLRLAGCICRRHEFVNGVEMLGMPLKMDTTNPSKELPSAAAVPTSSKEPSLEDEAHTAAEAPEPEDHPPTPHDQPPHPSDSLTSSSALPLIERRDAVIAHFRQFKAAASIALGLDNDSTLTSNYNSNNNIQRPSILPVQATPSATLDLVFQHGLRSSSDDDDVAFVGSCPQLYVDAPLLHAEVVRTALGPFLDRLKTPSRDSVNLVLAFISTFVEDSSAFLSNDRATPVLPWHVVPGYFVCVRAFVGVFRKVCLRRKSRRHVITKGADVVLNPWFPYWTSAELEPVYDGLGDVILENTNMYDPQSVDYAFNVLQNVFETAAASTHGRPRPSGDHPPPPPLPRGTLPMELDLEYFLLALRQALTSSHFQILLKVLAFVYATADLFESKRRQKLLAGVMLHEHFFPLFLHWNEESMADNQVRRMFGHLVVHKLFLSSRLDLPLVSDRVLLASSPFFRPQHEPAPHVLQGLASYFAPPPSVKKLSAQAVAEDHNAALERLIVWDTTAAPRQSNQKQKQERLFRDSLSNDDLMLDLSVTSKLDAMLKMIAEQVQSHGGDTAVYFPRHLQVYAQKALSQYVGLLWMYYKVAFDDLSVAPSAPTLEFNVQNFFSSD
ncbi:hypothetical protein DYB25_004666 [Aphanomyces astaci]|uniref:Uncharacterized protein n=2 Tax=Aphanomyces astaci TaxID=112090 RepID=A0A397AWK3_APHAT|nr:hypothetical protein DYB25_004666 [Aphanomyces astaci]